LSPALEMHLETLNYNLRYNFPKIGEFDVIAGLQGMFQTNKNYGEEILIPDASTTDIGFFTTAHYHLKDWDFQGGLRYDFRDLTTAEFVAENEENIQAIDRNYTSLNGALGAKYQLDETFILRLNLASGFRAPNLSELTSNGTHNGANRYEIGNPDLKNEQNFQADLSAELRNEHFEAFINAFSNQVRDYIYINPTNRPEVNDAIVYQYEQEDAHLYGGEIGFHLHPHPIDWLHLETSFETVTGKLDKNEYLPLIPANSLTNTFRVEFQKGKFIKEKYAFLKLKNVFAQNNPGEFETSTKGYGLLAAGAGGTFNFQKMEVNLSISGNNLLNKSYISHLSRLKTDNLFNIGRNFMVSANISI
ncbi:TonB-dependent receptor plug domain-containing protein, partial [Christiangramia aquimixticola]|uniref:TonB-dependent receptor plug domain-containing protein n=1 Tax=Christiangramia aquimixticola TaxID=1697558 RepID=UPI003AA8DE1E